MEKVEKLVVQQTRQLPELLQGSSVRTQRTELSLYSGELTAQQVVKSIAMLKKSFPALPEGFYEVLSNRIKDNNFCDDRLRDAVKHVIDTCVYPTPTIANFISFDRKVKLYTYKEVCDYVHDGGKMEDFVSKEIDGRRVWLLK